MCSCCRWVTATEREGTASGSRMIHVTVVARVSRVSEVRFVILGCKLEVRISRRGSSVRMGYLRFRRQDKERYAREGDITFTFINPTSLTLFTRSCSNAVENTKSEWRRVLCGSCRDQCQVESDNRVADTAATTAGESR